MNKGKIFLLFCLVGLTLSGCGVGDVGGGQDNTVVDTQVKYDEYEDSLDGLCKLLSDNGIVSGDKKDMTADFIGAEKGVKYQFKVGKSVVNVELYDYGKPFEQLNDDSSKVIQEVKNSGKIEIVGEEFTATTSNSGRYLMIYNDKSNNQGNVEKVNKAKDIVKNFKN